MDRLLIGHWPFLLLAACVLLFVLASRRRSPPPPPPPYQKRRCLLTRSELRFFHALRESVDDHWHVVAMVRLADLIRVRKQTEKRQAWQNRIHAKHIDFVLCHPDSMEVCLAIELDDPTHERPDRVARDRFVNDALAAAGLPLLRIAVDHEYDGPQLREMIDNIVAS